MTESCPNCHTALQGKFCANCGQNQKGFDRFFFSLVSNAFEDIFTVDSRAWKTSVLLMLRPGFLTKEYFLGRRARYVQPLRLYFITSLMFFFALSLESTFGDTQIIIEADGDQIESGLPEANDNITVDLDTGFLSEKEEKWLEDRVSLQLEKVKILAMNDPDQIFDWLIDTAPIAMLFLLPILALLLKIFYFSSGRYYSEHLVLAVHNHCFIYIAMIIVGIFDLFSGIFIANVFSGGVLLWIPVYVLMSLKTTYGGGWFITLTKYMLIGISYFVVFFSTAFITSLIGLMTL